MCAMMRFLLCAAGILALLAGEGLGSDLFVVGSVQTLAGGGIGEGGEALAAGLEPQAVVAGFGGEVYIADGQHNLVRVVGADGVIGTAVGSGKFGFNGEEVEALQADLQVPVGLAMGADGRLYVVDLGNRQVRVVGADGLLRTVLSEEDPAVGEASRRFAPVDVDVGADGAVYVADRGNDVVWVVQADGEVRRLAGTGERGLDNLQEGPADERRLADPRAVAVGADGAVYIADTGNRRVRKVGADGWIETVVGSGNESNWERRILPEFASIKPVGLAVDGEGHLLIADALRPRLLRLELHPMLTEIAVFEEGGELSGVAVDGQERYLVSGLRRVWRVTADGAIEEVAGNGRIRASGDGGDALNASLYGPFSLAYDREENLYIADRKNHLVRRVRVDGMIETVAGNGVAGFSGDGGPAVAASLHHPAGLTFDGEGNLHIADESNHRVRRVRVDGMIETAAGNGVAGFSGDDGPAVAASLHHPAGLTFDGEGNLYIADARNGRVRRVRVDGMIETVAGNGGTWPLEEGGPAGESALLLPIDVRVDECGRLVIVDAGGHRVFRVGSDGLLRVVAGTGRSGRGWDGSRARLAELARPLAALPDGAGGLYVADSDNGRVVHVDAEGLLRVLSEGLGRPAGLAWGEGNLLFADAGGNRVGQLPLARRWAAPEERVRVPIGYEVETAAALPVKGLLEVAYDALRGQVYVTRDGWLDRMGEDGVRSPYAESWTRVYSTLPVAEGLYVGLPGFLGYEQPLTLIRPDDDIGPLYDRMNLVLDGVDALGWNGRLLIHQRSGRLLRLSGGEVDELAQMATGQALLAGTPEGVVYVALKSARALLRLVDLNGDGRIDGVLELHHVAFLEEEPVGMSYGEKLYLATATRILRLEGGDRLEEFAAGFAPELLDIEAGLGSVLYALEGDAEGGRLLRLQPPVPLVGAWPAQLDFGAVALGLVGVQTLVVRNDGAAPVLLVLDENPEVEFAEPVRLEVGEVRRVEVRFAPQQRGPVNRVLVWRGAGGEELLRTPVMVDGLAPVLRIEPEEVDFGAVEVGSRMSRRLTLRNEGTAVLEVYRVEVDEPFAHGLVDAAAIAAGGELEIEVSLVAGEQRSYTGSLQIHTNDPDGAMRTIALRGRGGLAELEEVPEEIDLGAVLVGRVRRQQVELRNVGEVDLLVRQVLTGDRRLVITPRQAVVPPGATRFLEMEFRPRAYGAVAGVLSFVTNDPERGEVQIPFSGRGLSSLLQLSADAHIFAPLPLGKKGTWELRLSNFGRRPVVIERVESNNRQFRVVGKPERIAPGTEEMVQVEYRPTRLGETRGRLSLYTNLEEAAQVDILLWGRGQVATRLVLEPVGLLRSGAEVGVPIKVEEAAQLNGLVLVLALPQGAQFLGIDFPEGSLLAGAGALLVIGEEKGDGRLEVGISLTGDGADEGIEGEGLLGVLRVEVNGGGRLAIERAVFHSAGGAIDTLIQEAAVALALVGDFDGDGLVGLDDFFALIDRLGSNAEGPFDLDADGWIGEEDVAAFLELLDPAAAKAVAGWRAESDFPILLPVFPNPFNGEAELTYVLGQTREVELVLYNALGQAVRRLVAERQEAGVRQVAWDGRDEQGMAVGTGMYIAVLKSEGERCYRRLLLLR